MKIAIITLPLHTNYGGILQAYALRTVLQSYGNEVSVVELKDKMPLPVWWKAPAVYLKRSVLRLFKGGRGPEVFREIRVRREFSTISANTQKFINQYIIPVIVKRYDSVANDFDAFVVGSDQVWRPKYFGKIEDAFLSFVRNRDVLRFSYAASFGTDVLEYEYRQLDECSELLQLFDGVSVRESSAVQICDEWLDCDRAVQVLDPVMLLSTSDYLKIIEHSDLIHLDNNNACIVTYLLDKQEISSIVGFVERALDSKTYDISVPQYSRQTPVGERVVPSLEQWLSSIVNAEFVITDSFHVCVLCILFHKPFFVVSNQGRGVSRIFSLLEMFGLESRHVQRIDPYDDGEGWLMEIDWDRVDAVLEQKRKDSYGFIETCLKKRNRS